VVSRTSTEPEEATASMSDAVLDLPDVEKFGMGLYDRPCGVNITAPVSPVMIFRFHKKNYQLELLRDKIFFILLRTWCLVMELIVDNNATQN
jgi:hypothetical protein